MLPKKNRISVENFPKKAEVLFKGDHLSIKAVENNKVGEFRLGVVVSKGVAKSAVSRNRIKRLVYRRFKEAIPQLNQNLDLLAIVKGPIMKLTPDIKKQLLKELDQAIDKVKN